MAAASARIEQFAETRARARTAPRLVKIQDGHLPPAPRARARTAPGIHGSARNFNDIFLGRAEPVPHSGSYHLALELAGLDLLEALAGFPASRGQPTSLSPIHCEVSAATSNRWRFWIFSCPNTCPNSVSLCDKSRASYLRTNGAENTSTGRRAGSRRNRFAVPTPGVRLQLRLPPPQPRRASGRTRPARARAYCSRNSRPTSVNVKQQIANSRPLKRNWPRAGTFEALIKKQIPPGGLVPYRWRMAGRRGGCGRHGPPVLERAISTGFLPDASERSARTCQGADKSLPSVPSG